MRVSKALLVLAIIVMPHFSWAQQSPLSSGEVSDVTQESERTQILADIKKQLEVRMSGGVLQECHSMINYAPQMQSGADSGWGVSAR